jgi:ribonuclease HI
VPIAASDLRVTRLGPDAILVTFRSDDRGRRALRSSVWVRDPVAGWLLRFHQGTLID